MNKEEGRKIKQKDVQQKEIKDCLGKKKQNEEKWCYSYLSGYNST